MKRIYTLIKSFVIFPILWVFISIYIRVFEYISYESFSSISHEILPFLLKGLRFDIILVFSVSIYVFGLYVLVGLFNRRIAQILIYVLSAILLLIQLLLVEYFRNTLAPLDEVVFSYSVPEIIRIVDMSSSTNYWLFIPCVLLVYGAVFFTQRVLVSRKLFQNVFVVISLYILMFLGLAIRPRNEFKKKHFTKEIEYYIAVNKCNYFNYRTHKYLKLKEKFKLVSPEFNQEYQSYFPEREFLSRKYPLEYKNKRKDVLGPFFALQKQKPNIVFIIVESLGKSISGENASVHSFTPFLDSLSKKSLVFQNFLSNCERTFGVLPNIFSSAPYGDMGFTKLKPRMPKHFSLIKLLENNGYNTSFFYGGWAHFNLMDTYLKQNNIDSIYSKFDTLKYSKISPLESGFSWGYHDADLYSMSHDEIKQLDNSPRLDIYLSLSTHSPWEVQNREFYKQKLDEYFERTHAADNTLIYEDIINNYDRALCFFYADQSLREYFEKAKKTEWFHNTIFVITGDHRQDGFERKSQIDMYHVPLIIYSELLKKPAVIESVSSHSNLAATFVNFFDANYNFTVPKYVHWLGDVIDTCSTFRNVHKLSFMKNNKSMEQYVSGEYYIYGNQLFKIKNNMYLSRVNNPQLLDSLKHNLQCFKMVNNYVCTNNTLYLEGKQ